MKAEHGSRRRAARGTARPARVRLVRSTSKWGPNRVVRARGETNEWMQADILLKWVCWLLVQVVLRKQFVWSEFDWTLSFDGWAVFVLLKWVCWLLAQVVLRKQFVWAEFAWTLSFDGWAVFVLLKWVSWLLVQVVLRNQFVSSEFD